MKRLILLVVLLAISIPRNVVAQEPPAPAGTTAAPSAPLPSVVCVHGTDSNGRPDNSLRCFKRHTDEGFRIFSSYDGTYRYHMSIGANFQTFWDNTAIGVPDSAAPRLVPFATDKRDPCSTVVLGFNDTLSRATPDARVGSELDRGGGWLDYRWSVEEGTTELIKQLDLLTLGVYPSELAGDELTRAKVAVAALRTYVQALERELAQCRVAKPKPNEE